MFETKSAQTFAAFFLFSFLRIVKVSEWDL